ncbi:MAG: SsrA-binding protein [Flavobacteriales bacterium]|nr:SsrA-binding protein [Flavobacteriales bacterium]
MKKDLFRLLARLNKLVLPKLWSHDLTRLSKWQKALVGWRYYVTRNAL